VIIVWVIVVGYYFHCTGGHRGNNLLITVWVIVVNYSFHCTVVRRGNILGVEVDCGYNGLLTRM